MITTSILSKESIFIFANISLSLGYLTNFVYRALTRQISQSELIITTLSMAGILAVAHILLPATAGFSLVGIMSYANHIATTLNGFFMVRPIFVPPCKKILERIAAKFGFEIGGKYFFKPPFSLNQDRFVLDRLLRKTYGHDSFSEEFTDDQIRPFNNLLHKITEYMNKYGEAPLGYVRHQNSIINLENALQQLITVGNPSDCTGFIAKKLDYKQTKLGLLKQARSELVQVQKQEVSNSHWMRFFSQKQNSDHISDTKILKDGLKILDQEITRQQNKIESLQSCLP